MTEQGSPEWFAQRCGKLTASCIADAVARTKAGWGASRANLMSRLIVERLTGQTAPAYTSPEMTWGTEHEQEAKDAYAFTRDVDVVQAGFVAHPQIPDSGASPDGYVGSDGLLEAKCPNTATHIAALLGEPVPMRHYLQMQWQMECTGRAWCDYVSYDPRLPLAMRLHIVRVPRDERRLDALRIEVRDFLRELQAKLDQLRSRTA